MKLVKFTKSMAPYSAGETRVVPDDVADRLAQSGDVTVEASVFDAQPVSPTPAKRRYLTRERK